MHGADKVAASGSHGGTGFGFGLGSGSNHGGAEYHGRAGTTAAGMPWPCCGEWAAPDSPVGGQGTAARYSTVDMWKRAPTALRVQHETASNRTCVQIPTRRCARLCDAHFDARRRLWLLQLGRLGIPFAQLAFLAPSASSMTECATARSSPPRWPCLAGATPINASSSASNMASPDLPPARPRCTSFPFLLRIPPRPLRKQKRLPQFTAHHALCFGSRQIAPSCCPRSLSPPAGGLHHAHPTMHSSGNKWASMS